MEEVTAVLYLQRGLVERREEVLDPGVGHHVPHDAEHDTRGEDDQSCPLE